MGRIENLPDPMGGEGKLSPKLRLMRHRSHVRFLASLNALPSPAEQEGRAA